MTMPAYVRSMTPTDAIVLAEAVARDGLGAHHHELAAVASLARSRGLRPGLVAALEDPEGPPVARLRALGRIAVLLASASGSTPPGPVDQRDYAAVA